MRICHIITTIDRGGAENQLLVLVKQQRIRGDDVEIFPLKGALELEKEFLETGSKVNLELHDQTLHKQLYSIYCKKILDFDVVHCHLPKAELLMALHKRQDKVISRHYGGSFFPKGKNWLSKALSRLSTRDNAPVIAISKSVKQYLALSGEIQNTEKIHVVEYGFDAENFRDRKEKVPKNLKSKDTLVYGTLARLAIEKDLETLVLAASQLNDESTNKFKVHIFGEGPEREKIEKLISRQKLENKVYLLGRTQNPSSAYSQIDVFILTSLFEGFGMVLLEAMSFGIPIICSRIPTAVEVLGNNGAAVYFETGSPLDLAKKMLNLESFLDSNYSAEQEKRLEKFNANSMAEKVYEVYGTLWLR